MSSYIHFTVFNISYYTSISVKSPVGTGSILKSNKTRKCLLQNICRLVDKLLYCRLGLHQNEFIACIMCSMTLCKIDNFRTSTSFCLSYSFLFPPNFRLVKRLEIYMIMWLHVFLQGLLCVFCPVNFLFFSKIF